jgi:hypothetical protein
MDAVQALDHFLHAVRQRVVGLVHIREHRIAADRRDGNAAQQRTERGHRRERHVGVPEMASVLGGRRLAVRLWDVGDQQQLGIVGMAVTRQALVPVELAEAAAEGDVLLARDLLVAEQQGAALEEGAVDLVELGIAERLAEIDALDLGAQGMAQRTEGGRHRDLFTKWTSIMRAPTGARNPLLRT